MTVDRQRFCPVCDRVFNEGEPVLRCEGCGIVHHPGCWVRNGGCYTGGEHAGAPHPEAYDIGPALRGGAVADVPPAGSREPRPSPEILATRRRVIVDPVVRAGTPVPPGEDEPVIGRTRPNAAPATDTPPHLPPLVAAPRRRNRPAPYAARKSGDPGMPRIYTHRRILGYWYLPAAALVTIAVAAGVIWVADQFTKGDDAEAGAEVTPAPTPTPLPGTTRTATPPFSVQTAGADETPSTPDPNVKFAAGDRARVVGTGDCLNVRVGPGLQNDAIVCLPDSSEVTVLGGPQASDGFSWWQVDAPNNLGQGWAAEDYLERIP